MNTQPFFGLVDSDSESTDATVFALRRMVVRQLSNDCQEAGEAFMNESQYWEKAQLAMWLLGPYSSVAQDVESMPPSSRPQLRHIDANTIANVIDNARAEVQYHLNRLYDPSESSEVVFEMIEKGFVSPIVDTNGAAGWAPTTTAHRLADRVLSLFVAAFLSQVFERKCLNRMQMAA